MSTSSKENESTNRFVVIVLLEETDEEEPKLSPTIVPEFWLRDDNKYVSWPPSKSSNSLICKKVQPQDNWGKCKVEKVYWKTGELHKKVHFMKVHGRKSCIKND